MEKWDAAEKKASIANQRAKLADHATWRDKKATHVLIENGKKKALDMMEEAQTTIEDAHQKSVEHYEERMNLYHSSKEKIRQESQHFMDKLGELDAKSRAEHLDYEIMMEYIKNLYHSELEEV